MHGTVCGILYISRQIVHKQILFAKITNTVKCKSKKKKKNKAPYLHQLPINGTAKHINRSVNLVVHLGISMYKSRNCDTKLSVKAPSHY